MDNEKERVYWLIGSKKDKPYKTSTWYRCVGLQKFLDKVEEENEVVAIVSDGNNIGFILDNNKNKE